MDEFQQFLKESSLSDISILERVDEYTLYCFYLGYQVEIGVKHRSPLRHKLDPDEYSSFGVFTATRVPNREFMWKDHGTGKSGDIFRLLKELYGYSTEEDAYRRVDEDFGLGFHSIKPASGVRPAPVERIYSDPIDIRISSRPNWYNSELLYWQDYAGAYKDKLDRYNITVPQQYWLTAAQEYPIIPKSLCFAYRIGRRYKIYQPYESKDRKFRNNFTDREVEGFEQLRYKSDLLIITSSLKDVVCVDGFDYDSIGPRGENIVLPQDCLRYLESKYKTIVLLFNNDGKHSAHKYPYDSVFIPESTGTKDPSDHHKKYGHDKTGDMLQSILK